VPKGPKFSFQSSAIGQGDFGKVKKFSACILAMSACQKDACSLLTSWMYHRVPGMTVLSDDPVTSQNQCQSLRKVYAKFMHTCRRLAATAHELLQSTPAALSTVVVVGPTNSNANLCPGASLTRPVLLVPVRCSAHFMIVVGATPRTFSAARWTERHFRSG
jgi:hypothetical protein